MHTINRHLVVIKAKQPVLNWLRGLPDPDDDFNLEELRKDSTAILTSEDDDDVDGEEFVRANFREIFEMELAEWWTDKKDWPSRLDWKTFCEWFDFEFHSVVLDSADEPLRREAY